MPYAIKNNSWRAIKDETDIQAGESFSLVAPPSPPEPSAIVTDFPVPITAPDFIVASPKPKTNPKEAFIEALGEARKPHGTPKSIARIVLDLMEYIDDLEKRVDKLEKK